MLLGRMNDPTSRVEKQVTLAAQLEFDYFELTLEPPKARFDQLKAPKLRRALNEAGLGVLGHTAYWLPIGDSFPRVRQAAVDQLKDDLDFFAELGCEKCTVHPNQGSGPGYNPVERLDLLCDSFSQLVAHGADVGVMVLLENLKGFVGDPALLKKHVFDELPELRLTLDTAHAALEVRTSRVQAFLDLLGDRLQHVHMSDNDAQRDLHQPLGTCRLACKRDLRLLHQHNYDGTFTLEVFVGQDEYVTLSRELIQRWWSEVQTET